MEIHKNARLTPRGRERMVTMVLGGQTPQAVSEAVGVCPRTVRKWVKRYNSEGLAGLQDRSSRPHRLHRPTLAATVERIEALRRHRWTGKAIAAEVGVSQATVSRVLKRLGLNRLSALELAEPVRHYQREQPGELIHIDIKKLGKFERIGHRITGDRTGQSNSRGVGWEFVHVCIDDASRMAFSKVMKTERQGCAIAFLKAAVAYYASLGVKVERVMTDNRCLSLPSQMKDLSITPHGRAAQPRYQHPEKSQTNDHPGESLSDWNAVDRLDKIFSRDNHGEVDLVYFNRVDAIREDPYWPPAFTASLEDMRHDLDAEDGGYDSNQC